jgi:hypothetical protein
MKKIITLLIISSLSFFSFGQHPTNSQASNITTTTANLSWDGSMCSLTINLKYRITGSGSSGWTNLVGTTSPYLLTGLIPATSYEFYVKCVGTGGWSNVSSFSTDSVICNINTSSTIVNSTCNGLYNGSASVNATNGSSPYSYLWNNNDTTSSINNVLNNTYTVTVTDSAGCSITDTILIGFDDIKSISQSISTIADTSTPNYPGVVNGYYAWAYDTLSIINNGCDVNIRPEFVISHNNQPILQGQLALKYLNPINNLFVNIPYTIDSNGDATGFWNMPAGDSTGFNTTMFAVNQMIMKVAFLNQAPYGTYTAIWNTKEVDAQGNIIQSLTPNDTVLLSLINCNLFSPYSSDTNITCLGDSNGTAAIDSILNGSGSYSYNWVNNIDSTTSLASTSNINNLVQGNYSCTILDNNWGCIFTENFTISEPPSLTTTVNTFDVSCFGDSNGVATLNISGGTIPYGLGWEGNDPINLQAGNYTYTITDANGCIFSDSIQILQPSQLTSSITTTNITNCTLPDGVIDLNPTGGTGAYTYSWDNGDTTEDLNNLSAGTYSVNITDINNCSTTNSATINNYTTTLSISLNSPSTYNGYNIQCFGENTGNITSNTSGSVGAVTYLWSNGQDSTTATSLLAGNYTLTITDSLGCTANNNITLTQPNELTSSYTQTNVSCFGINDGSAIVNFFGGATGSNPGDTNYILGWAGTPAPIYLPYPQTVFNTNLLPSPYNSIPAGIYPYSVTDLNGCTIYDTITITQPNELTLSITTDTICCFGSTTGWANSTVSGGNMPYSFSWNNGDTTADINNVIAGNYTLVVTDDNNCTTSASVTILEHTLLTTNYSSTNINCYDDNNGSITTSTTGGADNYSYLWSNGSTDQNLTNLSSGTYTCTITDNCGCTNTISVSITQPNELTSSYTQTNVSCFGINDGSAIVNFFGGATGSNPGDTNYILGWAGTPVPIYLPYPQTVFNTNLLPSPYNSIPAGIYPYSVTDLNGCTIYDTITITQPDSLYSAYSTTNYNGFEISCYGINDGEIDIQVNGGTSPFFNYLNGVLQSGLISYNLSIGTYTDSIVDANGCFATNSITLSEPSELSTALNATNISCNSLCDGEINSNTSGGVSPYSYSWTNSQTTANILNLCAGNYTLTVTDTNGCTENISTTINEPSPITITLDSSSNVTIYGGNDGFIYITTNGGSSQFNINWTSADGFSAATEDIISLYASSYFLEITDSNLCSYLDTFEVTQPTSLWLYIDSTNNTSCYDSCNGTISITANGGDSTYSYSWIGPNGFTSNNNSIYSLCYGEYIITIDDGISSLIDTINIYQPQPITTILSVDSIICHNNTAQAEINVWGGTQSFTYQWSNGDTSYLTTVYSGNHSINITDQNGCSLIQTFSLSNPDSIFSQTTNTNTNCFGGNNGSVSINISSGGTPPYNFSNNNGITYQSSNLFNNLTAGNYSFLITDNNGCLSSTSAYIIEPTELTNTTITTDASCYDECDGSVTTTASGGTAPYSYDWGSADTNNLCAGFYNMIVTDQNGCISTNSVIINQPNPLLINIWIDGNNLIATSGFTFYQWHDNNNNPISGANDSVFTPTGTGAYYVTVTDTSNCYANSYSIDYNISAITDYTLSTKIFPNPTTGKLTISSEYTINSIVLYNTIGNQLQSVNNNSNPKSETTLDLSTFAKGVYFIKININNQIINQRILLQ